MKKREISLKRNISVHSEENGVINWDLELMSIMINIYSLRNKDRKGKKEQIFWHTHQKKAGQNKTNLTFAYA